MWAFAGSAKRGGFATDRRLNPIVCLPSRQLISRVVDDSPDPGWAQHVVDVAVLVVAPVETHFADLVPLQVVVRTQQSVHVRVQSLQVINRGGVELDLNEVFRIGSNDKVDIVPVSKKKLLDRIDYVRQLAALHNLKGPCLATRHEVTVE
eukprot:CAMPEP_0170462486 /NCGR_PEP_ID=MMETSP0123-20130129/7972_1 /TAXON_ID=182087 /ORGANISM="Favella ehrenbergii, Strain Fehren 1" /LENGTH=149 /DNA_ID=CAMNT_0010727715 /DNA_START=108 /DNA_END=557 /DNA_ORIENTATION=-